MFRLNLKIAFRNLWKNKGYTLINIAGLSVGMASCILIFIFIRYQLSFDQQFINKERIYRVVSYWKYAAKEDFQSGVPRPLAAAMRNDFGMLEEVAALQRDGGIIKVKDGSGNVRLKTAEDVFYVEPGFFRIFDYTWLEGNPQQALVQPNTVALSQKMASRFFGDWHKAVGQTFQYRDKLLKVTGVFADIPENNSNPINIAIAYAGYENKDMKDWYAVSSSSEVYILLKKGVDVADLEGPKNAFLKKYYTDKESNGKENHFFQPLAELHQDANYGNFSGKIIEKSQLAGLVAIGAFLMLTACINFINLATAQSISRSKEIGVRKVMGGRRKQLMVQFLTETLAITIFALLIACVLTEAALPGMNSLFREKISFSMLAHPVIFVFMIGLVLFISLIAGFYPAMVMSGFNPILAIKNKVSLGNSGGIVLRKVLVVFQFTLTVVLMTGTFIIMKQMKYMREKPLGFNPTAIAMVDVPGDSLSRLKYGLLKTRILNETGARFASLCSNGPSSMDVDHINFSYNGKKPGFQVGSKYADAAYFKTFNLQLISGKGFSENDSLQEYIVNETFLKKLNMVSPEDAIGQKVALGGSADQVSIVGVVKDFNNTNLRETISPVLFHKNRKKARVIAVKINTQNIPATMKTIESIWNSVYPDHVYEATFMEEQLNKYYESEQLMGTLFKAFALVIVFISFIGLFGLISFVAIQRTKEMAIRRVLGAGTLELVSLLNFSFIVLVLLANLIAWPIAYLLIDKWLSGYAYRIELNIWPFLMVTSISMAATLLTVSFRSFSAARTNPVDALKDE